MEKNNREPEMQEEWIKLEQYGIPKGEFIATELIQDCEGTKVVLDDEKDRVEIFFDGIPVLVRNTVEGMRMGTWGAVQRSGKRGPFASEKAPLRKEIRNSFSILGWTRTLPSTYIHRESCRKPQFFEKN